MMLILPPYAARVLRAVQAVFPEATIVGGFLRDLAIGSRPKDLDIFIGPAVYESFLRPVEPGSLSSLMEPYKAEGMTALATTFCRETMEAYGKTYGVRDEVVRVFEATFPACPIPVQIISTQTKMHRYDLIDRVDFDVCQVAHYGTGMLYRARFWSAIRANTATYILGPDADQERSERRAARWAERFPPGWVFVLPGRIIHSALPPVAQQPSQVLNAYDWSRQQLAAERSI